MRSSPPNIRQPLPIWAFASAYALSLGLTSGEAKAYDARIDASLDAQYYMLRSPYGEPRYYRRRYTSTLGLDVENLVGNIPGRGPRLDFRSRVRMDSDFGRDAAETDPQSNRYLPGLEQGPLDVMYAYLEGSGYAHGLFGFRVGRQYVVDALGYWGFDGALISLRLPVHLALSGFLGTEQRSGLPVLGSSRFGGAGVFRGSRAGLEDNQYPAFLGEAALAPAFGASLETTGLDWLYLRVGYRRVENRSRVLVSPFLEPGQPLAFVDRTRVSSERVGASLTLDAGGRGTLSARGAYDLFNATLADASVLLDSSFGDRVHAGLEYSYYYPTFDGDSIFNFFQRGASSTGLVRIHTTPGNWELGVASGARWFTIPEGASMFPSFGMARAAGSVLAARSARLAIADAGVRYRFGSGLVALDVTSEIGASSHRVGADLTTRRSFQGGRYDSLVLLSVHDFDDELREDRGATSFTYVLGGGLRPGLTLASRGRLGFEWEHSVNRLVGHRVRLLLTIDFTVLQ